LVIADKDFKRKSTFHFVW